MNIGELLKNMLSPLAQTNAAGSLFNKITGAGLTGAEQEANQFSSSEAEIARQWQEDMYNKYQSPSAMIDQYKEAGLNPALMYGGASGSSANFSSSSPSSVSPSSGSGLSEIINTVTSMAMLKANIDNVNADTELKQSEAKHYEADTTRIGKMTDVQIREAESRIRANDASVDESQAHARALAAQQALMEKQTEGVEKENNWIDRLHEIELKQRELSVAKTEAERDLIRQDIRNKQVEIKEMYSRIMVNKANAGLLSEETKNELERRGIIVRNKREAGASADIAEFTAAHLTPDRNWRIAGAIVGELKDVAMAAGTFYGAAQLGKTSGALTGAGRSIRNANNRSYILDENGNHF